LGDGFFQGRFCLLITQSWLLLIFASRVAKAQACSLKKKMKDRKKKQILSGGCYQWEWERHKEVVKEG
jgi:hypothetical protein